MSGDPGAGAIHGMAMGRLVHAIRARRQMEEQHQASQQQNQGSLQQHQQRQSILQNYDRAFGACLTGRGYSVQ
jgi:transcription initiation factor TFIID subunit TAF12